jgi:L-2-hydroxyglutarate oxidase LhgO
LLERRPDLDLILLEKEAALASHQTGHNSGVVHAGLYYEPGSLKARLCREGKRDLEDWCAAHDIQVERTGKLVVAVEEAELPRLAWLRERAVANGVLGLEEVGPERIRELEPHAVGLRALWSPETAVTDFPVVARSFASEVAARGGRIETAREVLGLARHGEELMVTTTRGDLVARRLVACAGLQADRVAAMDGAVGADGTRIVPFRGDYFKLTPEARHLVRGLIYPVPDPRLPFLGMHLTRRIDGEVLAGPNAVLATAREGYGRGDISWRDLRETVAYPGFIRLARRFWRTGAAEIWRDRWKGAFLADLRRYVPALAPQHLLRGPSGVRAQALRRDGSFVDDFLLVGSDRVLHVLNAPSPAATSSLAIGRVLAEEAIGRFSL